MRETIEALKTQNTDAQTAIQVALNGPDHVHKGAACVATSKSFCFTIIKGIFQVQVKVQSHLPLKSIHFSKNPCSPCIERANDSPMLISQ